jgi:hypothetical protein
MHANAHYAQQRSSVLLVHYLGLAAARLELAIPSLQHAVAHIYGRREKRVLRIHAI